MFKKTVGALLVLFLLVPFAGHVYAEMPTQEEIEESVDEAREAAEEEFEIQIMEAEEGQNEELDSFNEAMETMTETQEEIAEKSIAGFVVGSSIFILIFILVALLAFGGLIFNIIMIIDCANREFDNKTLWLAILIAGALMGWGLLPGLLYFFLVKKKLGPVQKSDSMSPQMPSQPPQPEQQ